MNENKQEFKYLYEEAYEVQKKLNQWSHQYWLKLHGFQKHNNGIVSVMVERIRKDD